MKKLLSLVLSLVLVCSLAGCGKEQSATYVLTDTQEGVQSFTDTQIIKAKGDIVYEMTEITVVDISMADEATKAMLVEYYDEYFGNFEEDVPEGVTVTSNSADDVYEIEININLEEGDIQDLMEGGYLIGTTENADQAQAISFSQTCSSLEAAGYELQSE